MYLEDRQPAVILPLCIIGSCMLNFWLCSSFPLLFKAQRHIISIPDLVEVDIALEPVEEEIINAAALIANEQERHPETGKIPLIVPDRGKEDMFLNAVPSQDPMPRRIPDQLLPEKSVVDRSGEFRERGTPVLSDKIDLAGSYHAENAGFDSVYVAIPAKKETPDLSGIHTSPTTVVDKGSGFTADAYAAVSPAGLERRSDEFIDGQILQGSEGAVYSGAIRRKAFLVTADLVEPVAARNVIHSVKPEYPEWAKKKGIEAVVILRFAVLPDGSVSERIVPMQTSGYRGIDEIAVRALKQWRFESVASTPETSRQWGQIAFYFKL